MPHYRKTIEFASEAEAQAFADRERADKCSIEDKYVSGPFFMDESSIFKDMPWANTGKTWWQVNVEIYR